MALQVSICCKTENFEQGVTSVEAQHDADSASPHIAACAAVPRAA